MSSMEFQGWMLYFEKRPAGWEEDLRTYRVMQSSGNLPKNAKPQDYFPRMTVIMQNARTTSHEGLEEGQTSKASFERSPFAHLLHEHWEKQNNDNPNKEPG